MAVSRYLIDVLTRHQVYLERLKAGEMRTFDPVLEKLGRLLNDILTRADVASLDELSTVRLERLIQNVVDAEEKLVSPYALGLMDRLKDQAGYEAQFAEQALDAAIEGATDLATVSTARAWAEAKTTPVQAAGKLLDPFVQDWTSRTLDSVEATIRNAHAQGWTVDQAVRALRGTRAQNYADGVLAGVRRNVEAMVRTSLQHVSNTARMAVYEENDDIVIGYRWISTLDNRTTPQCRSLDQQVFKYGKGPVPPIHIGCRSTTVPELAESASLYRGDAKRASKGADGGEEVPAGQTYYTWLKTQPASFQDTAIGPTRGKLLRNGGLSAEEFARLNLGRNFEPLTLEEMQKLAPEAFSKAGLDEE